MADRELRAKTRERTRLKQTAEKESEDALGLDEGTGAQLTILSSIERLQEYRKNFAELSRSIQLQIDDDTLFDKECDDASAFDSKLVSAIAHLKALAKLGQDTSHDLSIRSIGKSSTSVKLPKLEIDAFDGNPLKWQSFWDGYCPIVHENTDLSDIEKFQYLRRYLKGDPNRLASSYRLTSANYDVVIAELQERYSQPQIAVFAHLTALLELSEVTDDDASNLQKVYDESERHIRSLVALGLKEDTFGQVFIPIILSKLPGPVKTELYRKLGSDEWTLETLRKFFKEEIRARTLSAAQSKPKSTRNQFSPPHPHNMKSPAKPNHSTRTTTAMLHSETRPFVKKKCFYCKEDHFADQCKKYKTASSRRRLLYGRCFVCFSDAHTSADCDRRRPCVYCQDKAHHRSLCNKQFPNPASGASPKSVHTSKTEKALISPSEELASGSDKPKAGDEVVCLSAEEDTNLQTALTAVMSADGTRSEPARLIFDTCSSRTYIKASLAKQLGAKPVDKVAVLVSGFEDVKQRCRTYKSVLVDVVLRSGKTKRIKASVVENITCPVQKHLLDAKRYPILHSIDLAEPLESSARPVQIDILVGGDRYYDFVNDQIIRCSDGLVLVGSSLGYMTAGTTSKLVKSGPFWSSLLIHDIFQPNANFSIERFWRLEDVGLQTKSETGGADDEAVAQYNNTVKLLDGRYFVTFPWKTNLTDLPDNYGLCLGRLRSLLKRIRDNPDVFQKYNDTLSQQEKLGIIEKAPSKPTGSRVHYIAHHCIIKLDRKTTKMRIVYDASAKIGETYASLNECLLRGPVLLEDLCGMILRFRLHAVALIADIEKAFLQVALQEQERDVTRFLWVKTNGRPDPSNLQVYRFCRIPFGIISSPFLLAATVKFHLQKYKSAAAEQIRDNIYVDNMVVGQVNPPEAVKIYKTAKHIFSEASMNLREWYTNSDSVRQNFSDSDRGEDRHTKVLGLAWDTLADTLSTQPKLTIVEKPTKRQVLENLARLFDPCGFFTPISLLGKVLMQKLWQIKLKWDDPIPVNLLNSWNECSANLAKVSDVQIARAVLPTDVPQIYQLHCFTDASEAAYAASVYLVCRAGNDTPVISLLASKCRIAPIKELSIPRLELLGVLIGTRLIQFIANQLKIDLEKQVLWSDSQCVLHWLRKEKVSPVFVENRLKEIHSASNIIFKYVPSKLNPADLATRGCSVEALVLSEQWWHGPLFLKEDESRWPEWSPFVSETGPVLPVMPSSKSNTILATNAIAELSFLNHQKFSSFRRCERVVAWILRFCANAKTQKKNRNLQPLEANELCCAEQTILKLLQQQYFPGLLDGNPSKTEEQLQQNLNIHMDDNGLLRCIGRYRHSDLPPKTQSPVLIPKNSHLAELIVMKCHIDLYHSGVSHTLAKVREKYWLPHGRSQVRKFLRKCPFCIKLSAVGFGTPPVPAWPVFRVVENRPFSCVGLDYLGPLIIKADDGTDHKVWICLFTCACIRAIHLEVVTNQSSEQFLLCLRRFIATYGLPRIIISDNASQFQKIDNSLQKLLKMTANDQDIDDFLANNGIRWKYITEKAPWMGGFYERLVGLVKKALKAALHLRKISLIELLTVVTEISSVLNTRPIVYFGDETNIFSPSLLLKPGHKQFLPLSNEAGQGPDPRQCTANDIQVLWKRLQSIVSSFWQVWRTQYLTSLRERQNSHQTTKGHSSTTPTVGTVVIVKDDEPRNKWKTGRIIDLILSNDGAVRSVVLKLTNGSTVKRPIKLLHPLEFGGSQFECDRQIDVDGAKQSLGAPKRKINNKPAWFCSVCKEEIKPIHYSVKCNQCREWCHLKHCSKLLSYKDWNSQFAGSCCSNIILATPVGTTLQTLEESVWNSSELYFWRSKINSVSSRK